VEVYNATKLAEGLTGSMNLDVADQDQGLERGPGARGDGVRAGAITATPGGRRRLRRLPAAISRHVADAVAYVVNLRSTSNILDLIIVPAAQRVVQLI